MSQGGKRKGAGRPKGSKKTSSAVLAVRLTIAERRKAEKIGGGNASEGVRRALKEYGEFEKRADLFPGVGGPVTPTSNPVTR